MYQFLPPASCSYSLLLLLFPLRKIPPARLPIPSAAPVLSFSSLECGLRGGHNHAVFRLVGSRVSESTVLKRRCSPLTGGGYYQRSSGSSGMLQYDSFDCNLCSLKLLVSANQWVMRCAVLFIRDQNLTSLHSGSLGFGAGVGVNSLCRFRCAWRRHALCGMRSSCPDDFHYDFCFH